jgi:hypothetical protein
MPPYRAGIPFTRAMGLLRFFQQAPCQMLDFNPKSASQRLQGRQQR